MSRNDAAEHLDSIHARSAEAPLMTMFGPTDNGNRYELRSPTSLPLAGAFLWNQKMMVQVSENTAPF